MSFSDLVDKELKQALGEVAPPTKKHERMVKHIKANKPEGRSQEDQERIAYATAWKDYKSEGVGDGENPLERWAARLDDEQLKNFIRQELDPVLRDKMKAILHRRWMDSEGAGLGAGGIPGEREPEHATMEDLTMEDLDLEDIFEGELSTTSGDSGPDKKWEPHFEKQPKDAGEAEWVEPKPDYDSAEHRFSPKGVIELGVDDKMANKAYKKGGKVTKPTFDTSPYNEAIRVEHPLKGRGTVVSISEGVATIEWDRMDLRIQGPERLTKEQAQLVTVVEKYTDDPDAAEMGPKPKKKKKHDDKNDVKEGDVVQMGGERQHPDMMTPQQIKVLKNRFASIERIDPASPTYQQLTAKLDSMDDVLLQQLAQADINFVSMLARNRLMRRGITEDQYEQHPSFQIAPPPSMTIFQDQEPDDGKWKEDPLSTKPGAESASDGDEVDGEMEEPDDAPSPLNINDLGDPDSGRGDSIAKQVFSAYDGEGGDNSEIDYDSDRVDYDKQQDSSHNKEDQKADDSGSEEKDTKSDDSEEKDQDEGQDKDEGREEETMSKRKDEMELTGADLGFDLYESDITLDDMDVEGILTEDARPDMQGMGGGPAGVRDDKHGMKGKDNPDSPLHMKEHQLGQGEVAMSKELLSKLLAAAQGVEGDKLEAICTGLCNAGNKEDRTLDVQDIGMIMDEIRSAASGGGEAGADDGAELDQAMGPEGGEMDADMEEEETCEGCGEEGSYEDTASGDMQEPEGGAEKHRQAGKKQIMGSEGADEEEMTETEGSGTPVSDQKTKGKGPGGGSADEMGQKPSDDIIPPNKKGSQRGSLGPVTDSNPLPPGDGKGGDPMTEAWMAAIPGTVRNLDVEDHEIDPEDPDAELKMIKRRAGMDNWWKVD